MDSTNTSIDLSEDGLDSIHISSSLIEEISIVDKPGADSSFVTSMITSVRRTSTDIDDDLCAFASLTSIQRSVPVNLTDVYDGENPNNIDSDRRESVGFNSSGLNVTVIEVSESKPRGDGSDSGVESSVVFQRALSCNSGGYSSGGFDDLNKSCDSSLLSYSEETELMTQSLTIFARDGTSEGGSESSILDSDSRSRTSRTPNSEKSAVYKKKTATKSNKESSFNSLKPSQTLSPVAHKHTVGLVNRRQNITPIKSPSLHSDSKTNPISKKDKDGSAKLNTGPGNKITGRSISNLEPRRQLSAASSPMEGVTEKRSVGAKPKIAAKPIVSTPRPKTIKTEYDGRWPSSANRTPAVHKPRTVGSAESKRSGEVTPSRSNHLPEPRAITFDRYGTLPRRSRKRSPEPSKDNKVRSFSVSRDQSVSRVRKNVRDINNKVSLPFVRRKVQKTRIYHEISVQTALTSSDVEKALEGICFKEPRIDKESRDQEVQVDRRHEAVEKLEIKLKSLTEENINLKANVDSQKEALLSIEERLNAEKAAKEAANEELHKTEVRLLVMLGKGQVDDGANCLQELETHMQSSGQVVIRQQKEIFNLQSTNRSLHRDLEKSLAAQKELLQQQQETEAESVEMQEFLQAEKTMLSESLRDTEAEVSQLKTSVAQKGAELERRQEECNHLVRISEQRRQENLMLQGRLNGLDQRSKDLLLQQGAAVSGAAVALSGLSSRLDGLVDQLVTSYDISEKDLEDVIFHNEAYSKSNGSSAVASPEKTLNFHEPSPSPKRRASFLSAVVKAIRNATTQSTYAEKINETVKNGGNDSKSNGVSRSGTPAPDCNGVDEEAARSPLRLANSESLHNLSQAILDRQHFEDGCEELDAMTCGDDDGTLEELGECARGCTFVDQIIEVDNLVTRLLKVLRIIQLDNDTNVDDLQEERVRLEEEVRREQDLRRASHDEVRSLELLVARLRGEVQEAKLQLERKVEELEETKTELKLHREQVRSLTNDNWKLSSAQKQLRNCGDEAKGVLEKWKETGDLPSPNTIEWILTARNEMPALQEKLAEKENQLKEMGHKFSVNKELLTQNLHQAANEIRRQYEAIDNALEILQSIQGVVQQCPPLAKLQRDLEEANFQCASTQPIVAADLNANAALMSANEIHNGGMDVINNSGNIVSSAAY